MAAGVMARPFAPHASPGPDIDAPYCNVAAERSGEDLRRLPIEERKRTPAELVGAPQPGLAVSEHFVGDGEVVYRQACKFGCEGIVSKRLGSSCHSGRSRQWIKVKNPMAPAVRREAEGDWRC